MEVLNPSWQELAPLFHYYVTRFERFGADSNGALGLDVALQTLANDGICLNELHHPLFEADGMATRPAPPAFVDGQQRRLARNGLLPRYRALLGPSRTVQFRDELKQDRPVIVGFTLPGGYPDSFLSARTEWTDPTAPPSEKHHCALIVGFNDARRAFQIHDSQGESAFDQGRWWMGYSIVDSGFVKASYSFR
jgi:hypothetical protein